MTNCHIRNYKTCSEGVETVSKGEGGAMTTLLL